MPTISDTCLLVTLPSGNKAVYSVQPQHVTDIPGYPLNRRAIDHGTQIAHEKDGRWYKPGAWEEITDRRTIELLETTPDARDIEAYQNRFIG